MLIDARRRESRLSPLRILFALPGLHAVDRGAEIAFIAVATELARDHEVTLIGTGPSVAGRPYRYRQVRRMARERFESFPKFAPVRSETAWEELSFVPGLLNIYRPSDYDVTVTCAYPFTNWALRRPARGGRPKHVFVTQNGDWPAYANNAEYRWFDCDGLICINPDYFDRNSAKYRCALIPNGVDIGRFVPGSAEPGRFGIPLGRRTVLMVSAMIASKNVAEGIRAVAALPDAQLVVAGDGPLRGELQSLSDQLLPGRYFPMTVASADMPALYRSADVFLHLSRDESFGNAYVEAMACGKPVVAFDLPRTRWIVGDDAFLVNSDTKAVTSGIEAALRGGGATQQAMVDRAANFDWSRIAQRYLEFFQDVVARG